MSSEVFSPHTKLFRVEWQLPVRSHNMENLDLWDVNGLQFPNLHFENPNFSLFPVEHKGGVKIKGSGDVHSEPVPKFHNTSRLCQCLVRFKQRFRVG